MGLTPEEMKEIEEKLREVIFYPGPKADYEDKVGHKVREIDTGNRDCGITFIRYPDLMGPQYSSANGNRSNDAYTCEETWKFKKYLVEQGIEALVNTNLTDTGHSPFFYRIYGLPVAKYEEPESKESKAKSSSH